MNTKVMQKSGNDTQVGEEVTPTSNITEETPQRLSAIHSVKAQLPESTTSSPEGGGGSPSSETGSGGLNIGRFRLNQDFTQLTGVKKHITKIPVMKMNRHVYFRIRPEPEFRFRAHVFEDKEDINKAQYLVEPDLVDDLLGELAPKEFFLGVTRQKVHFLVPVRLYGENDRPNDWNTSLLEGVQFAMTRWVRLASNTGIGAYEIFEATNDLGEPEWPEMSMEQILGIAFRGKIIDSADHTLLRRLRGEI